MGGRRVLGALLALGLWGSSQLPARADTRLIDSPTAEPLGHGFVRWETGLGPEGSLLSSLSVGLVERLHFGLSYGLQDILGRGEIDANPRPGIQAQVLLLDELGAPALALGFDSQGRGTWLEPEERYERKSLGFYAVTTYSLLAGSWWLTALTGGTGYSLEGRRESFDLFAGLSQGLGHSFTFLLDYDFGIDDRTDRDRGYLDLGVEWAFGSGNHVRFIFRDLLENAGPIGRELNFFYLFQI
jgi:hypothetical protein